MKFFQSIAMATGLVGLAQAHMEMIYPPPFKSKANPYAGSDIDYSMTAPLSADGSNYPCKGYQSLLGTDAGQSTATFAAGGEYNMTITGGANHGGGSCQASLSFDKGSTWKVIHSYEGNCPTSGTSSYSFTVPSDTPSGEDVLFAWTWFNEIGNREMYMNCASVTITGSSSKREVEGDVKRATSFDSRPSIFVANVGNGCTTIESCDIKFPNTVSGEVTESGSNFCSQSCSEGDDAGSDSGSGSGTTSAAAVAGSTVAYTQPAASSSATSAPGGVFITVSQPAATTPTAVSTLITVTKSAGSSKSKTPSSATSSAAKSNPTSGVYTAGTACSPDGLWNCVDGTQYQRCASGLWSVLMDVASGTQCETGTSDTFTVSAISSKKRRSFRRGF